ncbi:MAG TPA: Ig-like domain repeat protein [Candidatus Dormibacteraeota bacterium]
MVAVAATLVAGIAVTASPARAATSAPAGAAPAPSQNDAHSAPAIPAQCQNAAAFVDVAWQGPSCQASGKLVVRLRNGHALTVAPPDTIAALASTGGASPSGPAPASTTGTCVNPATHTHVELYYAHFAGQADNIGGHVGDIQTMFAQVDSNYVDYDSRYYGGPDMHLYVECDGSGNPIVHDIGLSTTIGASDFSTIVSDMQNQGHTSSLAHYWVWTDGNPTSGYAGQSSVIGDDSPGAANAINSSDAYSVNYGYTAGNSGASIFAHENGHAMGAVQLSAPDSTGAWHCTDGRDVMCYNDGGPNGRAYTTADCGNAPNGTALFDCRRDDYFNPCPAPGTYLSNHWDVASVNNDWLNVSAGQSSTAFYYPPQSVIQGTSSLLSVLVSGGGCGGGTVKFTYSGGTLGTGSVASNGIASVSLASLPLGHYSVNASFSGSGLAGPSSTTTPATFDVIQAPFKSLAVMNVFGGGYPVQASLVGAQPENWPGWGIAAGMALTPDGKGGYMLDGWGGVHAFGDAPAVVDTSYWPGWNIARAIVLRSDGKSGYLLDAWGGLHPFGVAGDVPPPVTGITGYWPGWDIARGVVLRSDGVSGYVLDAWGGVHAFGGAPGLPISAYWFGWGIAHSLTLDPDGRGGYVLDGLGGLHPFGNAPSVSVSAYWANWDIARSVVSVPGNGAEGWVLDGFGGLHPYGGAPSVALSTSGYWPGSDVGRVVAAS